MKNLEIKNEIKKMSLANIEGKLTTAEMENIMAGSGLSGSCWASLGGALLFGAGGMIFAATTGGVGGIAFAMAANYWGWGSAAYSCRH